MASRQEMMQRVIRLYKETTGATKVDMREVAKFAVQQGWKLPPPTSPLDRLAKEFSRAAREEIRHDKITGKPYRANLAVPEQHGTTQLYLWIDIDEAPRKLVHKSLIQRREQMVGDGVQLTLDAQHWNNNHPDEAPIQIPMDFTEDIEWRLNAPDEEKKAS